MRKTLVILAFLLPSIGVFLNAETYSDRMLVFDNATPQSRHFADSIMKIVVDRASQYANTVDKYETEIYIKGRTKTLKKNWLFRFAPKIIPVDRYNSDMLFEMVSESQFNTPNNFKHNIIAANGNSIPNGKKQEEILTFLNFNVYTPIIYNENIIMPVAHKSHSVYSFNLEETIETKKGTIYRIRFMPKQWSEKLVSGDMWISDGAWTIEKIDFNGRLEFAEFNMVMEFGKEFNSFILPERAELKLRYSVLGNIVETHYHASYDFKSANWIVHDLVKKGRKPLDLTQYYTITVDSIPIVNNSIYWETRRDKPLTEEEGKVIKTVQQKSAKIDTTNVATFMDVSEQLTNTMTFDYRSTRIRYSGILNPFQLGYSSRNGVTYKQQLRITKNYENGRQLYFRPEVGFVFKRKEFYFKVYGEWTYKPERKGSLSLLIANGNQNYSSEMMEKINEHLKDSVFTFNDLKLDYFRHYYTELTNKFELVNGLMMNTILSYHSRIPVKKKLEVDPGEEVENIINKTYNDFMPSISFTYTPRQFYRMNGKNKEYVYSYFPTFSIEYARAIPGILNSSGDYGRIEMDIHQSLPLGLLRKINYHVSTGMYYNDKSTYFADFRYFARQNFPNTWGDDKIGGVFHLLKREWFNASDKYAQVHLMYESPFIFTKILSRGASRYIVSERFYVGQLWTPAIHSYTEVGYGIGNHIFNIGIFAGFQELKYQGIGVRFAFELF